MSHAEAPSGDGGDPGEDRSPSCQPTATSVSLASRKAQADDARRSTARQASTGSRRPPKEVRRSRYVCRRKRNDHADDEYEYSYDVWFTVVQETGTSAVTVDGALSEDTAADLAERLREAVADVIADRLEGVVWHADDLSAEQATDLVCSLPDTMKSVVGKPLGTLTDLAGLPEPAASFSADVVSALSGAVDHFLSQTGVRAAEEPSVANTASPSVVGDEVISRTNIEDSPEATRRHLRQLARLIELGDIPGSDQPANAESASAQPFRHVAAELDAESVATLAVDTFYSAAHPAPCRECVNAGARQASHPAGCERK
jgi:hypothetical protein